MVDVTNDAKAMPSHSAAPDQPDDPDIEITVIRSSDLLNKSYGVGPDGRLTKISDPFLSEGSAHRLRIPLSTFASEMPDLLQMLRENECLVLGAMSDEVEGDVADLTTMQRHRPREPGSGSPLIWRGDRWLGYWPGQLGTIGIDHDEKDLPPTLRQRLANEGGLMAVLEALCPALCGTARVIRPSVSTGILATGSGITTDGGGLHEYLLLAGWGHAHVSEAGSVSIRSLVDLSASASGSRIWFESPAKLGSGLVYMVNARNIVGVAGKTLDTDGALAPLTSKNQALCAKSTNGSRRRWPERLRTSGKLMPSGSARR